MRPAAVSHATVQIRWPSCRFGCPPAAAAAANNSIVCALCRRRHRRRDRALLETRGEQASRRASQRAQPASSGRIDSKRITMDLDLTLAQLSSARLDSTRLSSSRQARIASLARVGRLPPLPPPIESRLPLWQLCHRLRVSETATSPPSSSCLLVSWRRGSQDRVHFGRRL